MNKQFYEKPITIISAPTGSGKTFNAIEKFLSLASQSNFICIVAFPTKVLIEENISLLQDLKKKNPSYKNVEIETLTYDDPIPENILLDYFFSGGCVLVTLHHYLIPRGDFYNLSTLFYFIRIFKNKVKIFIDEVHLFLENFEKIVPITHGFVNYKNQCTVVENSNKLKMYNAYESYMISQPFLYFKEEQQTNCKIISFTTPNFINLNDNSFFMIKEKEFNRIISYPTLSENESPIKPSPEAMELYDLQSFEPFIIDDQINYENKYTIVRKLLINKNESIAQRIKMNYQKNFIKILNYNSILVFLRFFQYGQIYNKFRKKIKQAVNDNNAEDVEHLLYTLQLNVKTQFLAKEQELKEFGQSEMINNSVIEVLDSYFKDFREIFYKNQKNTSMIQIPDKEIAFISLVMFSHKCHVRTSIPLAQDGRIMDFGTYIKRAVNKDINSSPEDLEDYQKSEEFFESLADYDKPKNPKNLSDDSKNLSNDSKNLSNDSENSELFEYTPDFDDSHPSSPKKKAFIQYANEPPFTSAIVAQDGFFFNLFSLFPNKTTTAVSATIPIHFIQPIVENLPDKVNVLKTESKMPKLSKLYLFTSERDYFKNSRPSWRKMWGDFGNFFNNTITEPSVNSGNKNDAIYGLMLAPTNKNASLFYKMNIPNFSQNYSLIRGSWERYFETPFNKKGSKKAAFCLRIGSIQSSLGAGLNLPNHKFLMLGADIFKPISTLMKYDDLSVFDARFTDGFLQLVQGIGRIGRKSEKEIANPDDLSTRVCFLTGCSKFPTSKSVLIESLKSTYEQIIHYDLNDLENQFPKLFKLKRNSELLEFFFSKLDLDFSSKIFKYKITNCEDLRYLILTNMVRLINDPLTEFSILKFSTLTRRLRFLIYSLKICDKITEAYLKKKDIKSHQLIKPFNIQRMSEEEHVLLGVIKMSLQNILTSFYEDLSSLSVEVDIEKNKKNYKDFLLKRILIIFFSQPKIKQLLEEKLNDY